MWRPRRLKPKRLALQLRPTRRNSARIRRDQAEGLFPHSQRLSLSHRTDGAHGGQPDGPNAAQLLNP